MTFTGKLIVGHDGSSFADTALEWALEWAKRTNLDVLVVRAWTMRTAPRPATQEVGYVPPASDFEAAVKEALDRDIATTLAKFPEVSVDTRASRGQPANVLVDASNGASLLVVGPRGLGGFRGLMLGSVSDFVVSQANCPVVVVRGEGDPAQSEPVDKAQA